MDHGGSTSSGTRRPLIRWEADHENGWQTLIVQQGDGTFVAWAMCDHERGPVYVDTDISHACAAVLASLYRRTGHRVCTPSCSDWRLRAQLPVDTTST